MKALIFSAITLLIPFCANSQNRFASADIPVIPENSEFSAEDFHIITPILMRDPPYQSNLNDNTAVNGNKFKPFFSSLIIPGSGQIKNKTWWKAGIFLAAEAASIYLFADYRKKARIGEREFEKWANKNWSVIQYSNWLVRYHEVNNLDNAHINQLRDMIEGEEATFNIDEDWKKVDLEVLRNVERNTPYVTTDNQANNSFSHTLPEFGSQQYYELISKYYQYQAGWKDYDNFHNSIGHTGKFFNNRYQIDRDGAYASPFFYRGAQIGESFNTDYRRSGYIVSILIANHIISAFDAYFTFQLKQNRVRATSSVVPGKQLILTYQF